MEVREQELTIKGPGDPDSVQGSDPIQHAGAAPRNGTDRSIAHCFELQRSNVQRPATDGSPLPCLHEGG